MSRKSRIEGALLPRIDVTREEDFAEWYKQVLLNGDMMDYHDLPGCFILKVFQLKILYKWTYLSLYLLIK
jgi:prolyl-tRNA synthetase